MGGSRSRWGLRRCIREILERLNKRMTLEMFAESARFLHENEIDLRAFILVQPPFMRAEEAIDWALRSLEFAFECGATAATLIPTAGATVRWKNLLPPARSHRRRCERLRRHLSKAFRSKKAGSSPISGTSRTPELP